MLDLVFSEISPTSGDASNGIALGYIDATTYDKAINSTRSASSVYAVKMDKNGTAFNFSDVTADATSDVVDQFKPFGTDGTFSAEDALFVACDETTAEVYVHITTSGVWTGDGFEVHDSTDGISANRELTITTDASNGMRAAPGMYRIAWSAPVTAGVSWTPIPGVVTSRKWIRIRPKNLSAVTTAPLLRRLYIVKGASEATDTDATTEIAKLLTDGDFTGAPTSVFVTQGDAFYFGTPFLAVGVDRAVWRRVSNVANYTFEYLANDDTWKPLPDVSDPSNDFENGPAVLGVSSTYYPVRWGVPSDWTAKALAFDSIPAVSKYWMRIRLSTVVTSVPAAPALYRLRAMVMGTANAGGLYHNATTVYRQVTFEIGVPAVTDTKLGFVNVNTGAVRIVTVPASTASSARLVDGRLDFSTSLSIGQGEELAVMHMGGGTLGDVKLHLS